MADQSAGSGEPRWLVEPRPGEAHVHIAVGEGAELTPELREALEGLASALHREEVEGYAKPQPCPRLHICDSLGNCQPHTQAPCAHFSTCRIVGD
jgi:hypothetical protein